MKRMLSILVGMLLLVGCAAQASASPQAESLAVASAKTNENSLAQTDSSVESSEVVFSDQSALPAAPEMEKGWWKEAFTQSTLRDGEKAIETCDVYQGTDSYSIRSFGCFGTTGDSTDFSLLLNAAAESDDIGKSLETPAYFEAVMHNDTIYKGIFYEKGIAISPTLPGKQEGKAVLLAIDDKAYKQVLTNIQNEFKTIGRLRPAWITRMREYLCSSLTTTTSDGKSKGVFTPEMERICNIISSLKNLAIEPDSMKKIDKTVALTDAVKMDFVFNDGSSCAIQCDGNRLIIYSSEKGYAIQYTAFNELKRQLNDLAKGGFIPETGKPVIYLYPQKPIDVTVKVDYKGQFTYTYPTYHDGWQVTAYPNGRLINKADGSEHYYLFWEGNAEASWSFDEGFVVKGTETERFLQNALSTMGLTPREYNDFIVYWLPEMQGNAYNLITFATKEYEALAPLTVSPQPDSILRVHMVYKALKTPIQVKEQKLTPFTRKGFTVVEWGGTRG